MPDDDHDPATTAFLEQRNLLFTVAYEILGTAADAEDVLQEAWLRWARVDLEQVREQRAFLVRITTRLALDRLRARRRRKETYIGPWLPEPLLTARDVAEDVELAESVSMAVMLVLETLSPTERVVFVLREAFGIEHAEIAEILDKSPTTVRQIAHRARKHVQARRPRHTVSRRDVQAAVDALRRALETGDYASMLDVLAPDVVLVTDGGGRKRAALRPITGADKVLRFVEGAIGTLPGELALETRLVNGSPALLVSVDGEVDGVLALRVEDAVVTGLYLVRNPDKITRLDSSTPLTRI